MILIVDFSLAFNNTRSRGNMAVFRGVAKSWPWNVLWRPQNTSRSRSGRERLAPNATLKKQKKRQHRRPPNTLWIRRARFACADWNRSADGFARIRRLYRSSCSRRSFSQQRGQSPINGLSDI